MKASIKKIIAENPTGLLEMKPAVSVAEYGNNFGFNLKNTFLIYESKRSHISGKDWYVFPGIKSLNKLFKVFEIKKESDGDLLVVYIVETIKAHKVYCHLVLTDNAFKEILNDRNQHVLKIHQMYSQFLGTDYIAMNMAS
jgi:hypothetical protein